MQHLSRRVLVVASIVLAASATIGAQVYKYFKPGTVWTVTAVRMKAGMDQAYLEYLDGAFKKETDAQIKAGFMKSYKLVRTLDDDYDGWNLLILREYASLAALEANEEKADALSAQIIGNDQAQMQGYADRSKVRDVLWTRTAREIVLK